MNPATCMVWMGLVLLTLPVFAQDNNFDQFREPPKKPTERPSANIALNMPYTLEPAPNDRYCTDPNDAGQLTDGVYSEGYFWVQKTTVGWQWANPAIVTLDLGADKPIRGASFHTAAGVADVTWPEAILLLVAGEDKQFTKVGDLVALSAKKGLPPEEGYNTHRFWTDALQTHGRYVAFVFTAQPYAFVDEIEIYEGDPAWLDDPIQGTAVADMKQHVLNIQAQQAIQRRITKDLQTVRALTGIASLGEDLARGIVEELNGIETELDATTPSVGPDFKAILPLGPLHARVLAAQAALWEGQGYGPVTLWQSPLWGQMSHMDPPAPRGDASIEISMMLNEFRAASFNLSNATQEPVPAVLRITGLPGGTSPGCIQVHDALWTGTKKGFPVLAALPELKRDPTGSYRVVVVPGLTSQVWLTFNPKAIGPGVHRGAVEVQSTHGTETVPLVLRVYPFRFPDRPTLHFGGWDHTHGPGHRAVTSANIEALTVHLKEHFVDSPWAPPVVMPPGVYDASGNMTARPGTAIFDAWVARWRGAHQFLVHLAVSDSFASFEMGTPAFDAAVKAWTLFWADHVRGLGLDTKQLAVLVLDEPRSAEQDAIILAWARAIRAAGTGIRIWEDPIYRGDMSQANQDMIAACHVLCPHRPNLHKGPQAYRDYFVARRNAGTALELYSCNGPVRSLDPYAYHRLQAWDCWKYGAQAMYFWAFSDTGYGSSWNEYAAPGWDYCPEFLDATSVTPGKHMEAAREGVEDFEYLVMLRDAIIEAEKQGETGEALQQARQLLAELPEQVLEAGTTESLRWDENIDRSVADVARVEILDALVALGGGE